MSPVMPMGVDPVKASMYYNYLHRAVVRIVRKEQSRNVLERQVRAIKKLAIGPLHNKINQLEDNINETAHEQEHIVAELHGKKHEHDTIQEQVAALEKKLTVYLDSIARNSVRLRELEAKVTHKLSSREERVAALTADITRLTDMVATLPKGTAAQRARITVMKRKLSVLRSLLKKMHM